MTCPDWRRLVAARERGAGEDPAGWREALEHLEACPRCRRAALEADPLLALRGLPEPALEADEGRRMVAATRALRRRQTATARWRWRAAAAVAVVTVAAALAVGSGVLDGAEETTRAARGTGEEVTPTEDAGDLPSMTHTATSDAATVDTATGARGNALREATSASMPSVLHLEQPTAHVYEVTDADLAVVVVVDQELDLGSHG